MAFDQTTRNRLARFVSDTRALLTEEFTRQLQNDYGLDPATGEVTDVARLSHLDDARRETARLLRDTMEHYLASADTATPAKAKKARQDVLDRILREQAFTVLNRLCALRMAEARGLLIESIAKSYQSKGFQLYQRLAGTALGETGAAYRLFLFSVFDEFAVDLAVLFDRFSPQGRLFPREAALLAVLEQVNHPDIDPLWTEDETIGWIYQYFNSLEERRQMRAESQAPRNSRELAVRNQFFTPRYVVEFLTDNTLGRIWYEMTKGETGLNDSCRYLVRRPNEIFLDEGQEIPEPDESTENMSQEELLRHTVHILHRPLKDPRDIRMLDPACGSMHFGLYAFDLFERIYEEAWEIEAARGPGAFTRSEGLIPLAETYSDKGAFLRDVPRLIIERNIHGIDIDPRAVQIAGLSLWLRAQRSWQAQGVRAQDRPQVQRSNIVCAEPMPGEADMLEEFAEQLQPRVLGQLVRIIFEKMELAGEAGSLLKIEEDIKDAIADAHKEYQEFILREKKEKGFLPGMAPERQATLFDFADLPKEEDFWHTAELRVVEALRNYAETAAANTYQRRLFADDAARGFAFIDICRKRYDVALMNPPFGLVPNAVFRYLQEAYPLNYVDVYSAFILRGTQRAPYGRVGAITSRSFLTSKKLLTWRETVLIDQIALLADFGRGVMDNALVDSAGYVLEPAGRKSDILAWDLRRPEDKSVALLSRAASLENAFVVNKVSIKRLPGSKLLYFLPRHISELLKSTVTFEPTIGTVRKGLTTFDDSRYVRVRWEVPIGLVKRGYWENFGKGGEYSNFYTDVHLVVNRRRDATELAATNMRVNGQVAQSRQGSSYYYRPGCQYTSRSSKGFSCRAIPAGCVMSSNAPMLLSESRYEITYILGWVCSRLIRTLIEMQSIADDYVPGSLKMLPWVDPSPEVAMWVKGLVEQVISEHRKFAVQDETDPLFTPFSCQGLCSVVNLSLRFEDEAEESKERIRELQQELSLTIDELYGCDSKELADELLGRDVISETPETTIGRKELEANFASTALGFVFGRWDIRYATSERHPPELPDPFDPLPVCPPGMLQNAEALPAEPKDVPADYPLRISWPGILVDDDSHPEDIVVRVREAIEVIWRDRAEAIEQEACEILGVKSLRDYFQRPASFFADHLKRYSKSRRQAPIYWPLSTSSCSYTLWLYYHRLTDQTLYTCVNDFVEPKLKQVADEAARLRTKTARSSTEEKDLERLSNLELELKDFRDELLRIARFWKPNLNDGVQITAAPLWRLFQHRPWQARLRETWEKLEAGDYDWAHLALSIWPDRVVRASHKDRSYAIAHDLEDRLWHEVEVEKVGRGGRVTTTTEWQPRDLTEADLKTIIAEVQAR